MQNDFCLDKSMGSEYSFGNWHFVYKSMSLYFLYTISALTERDWVVLQGNHAIMFKSTLLVRK